MPLPRWLSALLIAALVFSAAPVSVLAAPTPPAREQDAPSVASAPSYLLALVPPSVSVPAGISGFDAVGFIHVQHARYFAEAEARLTRLQEQGAIAGYTPLPSAYAFVVNGPNAEAQAVLPRLGQMQASDELSAASVDELANNYQRQLSAAIEAATRQQAQIATMEAPPSVALPQPPAPQSMAAAPDLSVTAVTTPSFRVVLGENYVSGYLLNPATVVTFTLKSASGIVKGTATGVASSGGNVYSNLNDIYGNSVEVVAGDTLEVQTPDLVVIPIADLRLTSVDLTTGLVTGVAPANITSTTWMTLPTLSFSLSPTGLITTTSSGTFSVATSNVTPGQFWSLLYTNAQNHTIERQGQWPILVLRGSFSWGTGQYGGDNFVSGALVSGGLVTVTLTRPGSPAFVNFAAPNRNSFGLYLKDLYGNKVDIKAGDTVQATDGSMTLALTVPTFTVASDATANTVSGTTNAAVVTDTTGLTQTLAVWPNSPGDYAYGKSVLAPGGSFVAANPFYYMANPASGSQTLDWLPNTQGHLRYIDVAGNIVYASFRAPTDEPILSLRGRGNYSAENVVYGRVDNFCGYGTVALLDAANVVKAQNAVNSCNNGSEFYTSFSDVYGNSLPILDGDSVVATFNGRTTTVKAPSLTLSANPATDIVAGAITPGLVITDTAGQPQSLAIYSPPESGSVRKNVLPDAAGAFSANFSGSANIQPGQVGFARYIDAKGNNVYARWQAPFDKPTLRLRGDSGYLEDNYVSVRLPQSSCSAERGLLLVVKTQAGAVRWQNNLSICGASIGQSLYDDYSNAIDLEAGDIVEATFDGQTTSVVVPGFAVVSDSETDTVSGLTNAVVVTNTANLTQTLAVWPTTWSGYGKHVLVAAGGVFSATNPFYNGANPMNGSATLNWGVGESGYLRYIDAAGNYVYDTFAAKVDQPQLTIYKDNNVIRGMGPDGNAPVTVTVKSGATVKGVGYDTTAASGSFGVDIFDGAGNPVDIVAGDEIVFSQPVTTVVVPPLSIVADVDNDRISGKGPANTLLEVYVEGGGGYRTVATNASGDYLLDLRGEADVTVGAYLRVTYLTPEKHTILVEGYAGPMLSAALNTNSVWGYAPGTDLPITVTVKRGGAVVGVDSFVDDSFFSAYPIDVTGRPVLLAAGDVIELDLGAGVVKSLTLDTLSLAIDEQNNRLSGVGPAGKLLGIVAATRPTSYSASVTTDGAGAWAVDLAASQLDVQPGATASVRYSANGVDTTWLYGVAPVFWIYSGENGVEGYSAPQAPVTITLKRNGGVLATAYDKPSYSGYYYVYLYDVNGMAVEIAANDVIEVKGAQTVAVTVPVLSIMVDSTARIVSGVGPANARLGVATSAGSKTVVSDAAGAWSINFASATNSNLSWAQVEYREPQGNWIVADTIQLAGNPAILEAGWDAGYDEVNPAAVSGSAGAGPRLVLLTLKRSGGVIATASDWSGSTGSFTAFFRDAAGELVNIQAGDVIEMVAGDVSKSMTVAALSVQANLDSETLFGTGPANTRLYVSGWCSAATTVDPASNWVIDCDDLDWGDDGYVYVTDLLGNSTYMGWSVPVVRVREYGNEVQGTVALGAEVQVQLRRGAAVIAEASDEASSSNGYFYTEFFSTGGSPIIIQPNDVVVVNAGAPITVPVVPLTAVVDSATDRISGVGPANDELEVTVWSPTWVERIATTGADGSYIADFTGELDVRPGDWLQVTHYNADGDEVWLGWNAPLVRINLGSDIVDGYATPNSLASLVLKRGGTVVATAEAETSPDGAFSAYFRDASGNLIDLVAGDVVEVTASPTVATAAITLTASVDTRNDTVSGAAPAGATLMVVAYTCSAGGCSSQFMTVIASDAGVYVADFSRRMDLGPTSYAYVEAADASGNQTTIVTTPPEVPLLKATEETIASYGAVLTMSSYGTANGGNLTPPQSFTVVGGGRLIFSSRAGSLVITAPDGTITRPDNSFFVVENPRTGKWQVQVEAWGGSGRQYTIAAGLAQYNIYMPTLKRQ